MHIICLTPLEEGVYNDHKANHITTVPDGWAYIPEDFPLPSTFPRLGSIEAKELTYTDDEKREYKRVTVTAMTEGTLPEPEPEVEPEPTTDDVLNAMLGVM